MNSILRTGSEAGALLVDGLGDGIMLSVANDPTHTSFPLEMVRTTAFFITSRGKDGINKN